MCNLILLQQLIRQKSILSILMKKEKTEIILIIQE